MGERKTSKVAPSPKRAAPERRRSTRNKLRFRVVIKFRRLCFRSFTSDVSQGGLRLVDQIPSEFLGSVCEIFIGSERGTENIKFTGKVFDDPQKPLRIQFEVSAKKNAERLSTWLLQHAKKS